MYRDQTIIRQKALAFSLRPLELLKRMTPEERLRAYWTGVLMRAERTAWAGAYPDEVPLVNDELEWIVANAECRSVGSD